MSDGKKVSQRNTFDVLVLNGRPAAGKSEVIDYLKKTPLNERVERFHIGAFDELDDFPILWERFEDDDIWERHKMARAYTTSDYYFKEHFFWNFLIEKLNLRYSKLLRDDPYFHATRTVLVEFSRGGERGWQEAYGFLSREICERAATLYIRVSYEESFRRNRRRFNPERPDSILQHGLPDVKMEQLYKLSDWEEWTARDAECLHVGNARIPYAIFQNEPEVTDKPKQLGDELERVLGDLWHRTRGGR